MPLIRVEPENLVHDENPAAVEREAEEAMQKLTDEMFAENQEEVTEDDKQTPPAEQQTPPTDDKQGAAGVEKTDEEKAAEEKAAAEKAEADKAAAEAAQAGGAAPEEEDEEDKILKTIKLRDDAKPKTKEQFSTIREIAEKNKKEARELRKAMKLKEEEALKAKVLSPEQEKEFEELRAFKRASDIERDPEFSKKFNEGAARLDEEAFRIFKAARLPESTADFIKKNGGLLRFRSSNKLMPAGLKDNEGNLLLHNDGTSLTHREFYENHMLPVLDAEAKDAMADIGLEARRLARERDAEIQAAKAKGDGFYAERNERFKKEHEEFLANLRKQAQETVQELGEVATKLEIPKNATAEEKAEIERKNARFDRAQGLAIRLAQDWRQNLGRMSVITAYHETAFKDTMNEKDSRIKQLEGELATVNGKLDAIKNAGKTNRNGAAPHVPPTQKPNNAAEIDDPEERMAAMTAELGRR